MITIKKYKCNYPFRTYWNKYAKGEQYNFKIAECTCIYVFGLLIWKNLKSGGIFISDDIEDNTAFLEFVKKHNFEFSVLEFEEKYVGVIKKH